jgi:hypothetical protein
MRCHGAGKAGHVYGIGQPNYRRKRRVPGCRNYRYPQWTVAEYCLPVNFKAARWVKALAYFLVTWD